VVDLRICDFVPFQNSTWLPELIMQFDWLSLKVIVISVI
jgi:hypothetical protein